MKICVLIKQVPDKDSSFEVSSNNISIKTDTVTWVSNESDNYALEEALLIKEADKSAEVVVCTLGLETAHQVLKDALAKGADRAIHLCDPKFNELDILSKAKIFASVLKKEKFDLIFTGLQSDDEGNSQLGLLLAELLDLSHASLVMGTEIVDNNNIKAKRELENGWFQWTELSIPASISIQSGINTPRYATLKGIMMVKNKTIDKYTFEDIEIGDIKSKSSVSKLYAPIKSKETKFIEGSNDEIASELLELLKNEIKVVS